MIIETVFWFHPLVWWVGRRIFEERERACDEDVLRMGGEPHEYARGILKICEFCLQSPIACVAGISGANLRKRIEAILNKEIVTSLNGSKKALLVAAGMFVVALPVTIGLIRAQTVSPTLRFEVASVKPAIPTPGVP